ncbi:MAG: DUF2304 domain-containing protein [Actinobacteria bacterium]|nr:DUF2304 domain-containing protein [Actinomycetota bacterium]
MLSQQQIVGALLGFAILAVIAMLVYRRKLTEERAAIWLAAGLLIFILSISGALQRMLGALLGSKNVPATILAVGVLFLLAICLDLSIQVTRLSRRAKNVSQEQALLEHRVAELENCRGESRGAGSDA